MFVYLPQLLVLAGHAIIKGMAKRNQTTDQPSIGNAASSAAPVQSPAPAPWRAEEAEFYGGNLMSLFVGTMAKLTKADGAVSKEEVAVVEGVFADLGMVGEIRQQAIAVFQVAKDGPLLFSDLLALFEEQSRQCEAARQDLIFALLRIAHAEGSDPSYRAKFLIRNACTAFDWDYQQSFDAFYAWQQATNPAASATAEQTKLAYEILACTPADDDAHLKGRYRQLVRDFHPDTIAGKGLSPEFTRFAEEKFKQIQAADELLIEQRR